MATRLNIVADARLAALKLAFQERQQAVAEKITPENFRAICPASFTEIFHDALRLIGADEGSIWIYHPGKKSLTIAHNSGPNAAKIVGYEQPLTRGLVSVVLQSEQSFIENEVYRNQKHDRTLNDRTAQTTYAMIVVPFYYLNECRGVLSGVQLINARFSEGEVLPVGKIPPGFRGPHLEVMRHVASAGGDLIDHRLLKAITGWSEL